jgi:ABC-2 type transport system permease protein
MTAAAAPVSSAPAKSRAADVRARFRDLLAAEAIKLRSLRSTWWVLGLGALAIIAINVNAAHADYDNWPTYGADIRSSFDPYWAMRDAFNRPASLILVLAAGSIGALMIVSEYSTGLIRTTYTAVPARGAVAAAKVTVLTGVMLLFGIVVAAASFGLTQAVLSGRHAGESIGSPGALRVMAGAAILAPVCGLAGLGIGALIRHSASTIVALTIVLLVLPLTIQSQIHPWVQDIHNAMPYSAWVRLSFPGPNLAGGGPPYSLSAAGAWLVYGVWAAAAVVVAVIVMQRRDV